MHTRNVVTETLVAESASCGESKAITYGPAPRSAGLGRGPDKRLLLRKRSLLRNISSGALSNHVQRSCCYFISRACEGKCHLEKDHRSRYVTGLATLAQAPGRDLLTTTPASLLTADAVSCPGMAFPTPASASEGITATRAGCNRAFT